MDSTSMRELGRQLLELGHRVLDEADAQDAIITADDIRRKKLDNAMTIGGNFARSELYADESTVDDLRHDLMDRFRGDGQLVQAAVDAARAVWRDRAAA